MDAISFIDQFYQGWEELRGNPLFIGGISYGGVYAPRLAYAIHLYNQERAMHNQSVINLKGFFAANGVIDYTYDPHVTAVDLLLNFGIVPLHLKEDYDKNNCHVEWVFFYIY
jgi:carboxypeptidase C (cathepsin A)